MQSLRSHIRHQSTSLDPEGQGKRVVTRTKKKSQGEITVRQKLWPLLREAGSPKKNPVEKEPRNY